MTVPQRASFVSLAWLVILPLVLVSVANQVIRSESLVPMDFYHYWVVDRIVSSNRPVNIYSQENRLRYAEQFLAEAETTASEKLKYSANVWRDELRPTGTPFLYLILSPLMGDDYDQDLERFRLLSLLVYLAGIVAIARLLRFPWPLSFLTILLFSGTFEPHTHDVLVGNLNQVQIGMIALLLWALKLSKGQTAGLVSGILFAILLFFKPTVLYAFLLFAGYRVVTKDFQFLARFVGSFLGTALLVGLSSGWFFGSLSIWMDWFVGINDVLGGERYYALTFLGHVMDNPPTVLFFALGVIFVALPLGILWRNGPEGFPVETELRDELLVGLGLGIYLLAGNVIHSHYFVLAIPLVLVVLRGGEVFGRGQGSRDVWMPALGSVAYLMICGNFFQLLIPLELRFDISFWSYLGVLILVGSCLYRLVSLARADPPAAGGP
jgi:hypothetical protein